MTPPEAAESDPIEPTRSREVSSSAERLSSLQRVGFGWQGRRALSEMIRSHSVGGPGEALSLICRLESPHHRTWCLGDLVAHWDLQEADLEKVLEAAPSRAAGRRLGNRAARPGLQCDP